MNLLANQNARKMKANILTRDRGRSIGYRAVHMALIAVLMLTSTAWANDATKYLKATEVLTQLDSWINDQPNNKDLAAHAKAVRTLIAANQRIREVTPVTPELRLMITKGLNAWTDNKSVVVTFGLLQLIKDDGDAMGALLGHEYAHIIRGHIAKRQAVGELIAKKANNQFMTGYRSFERMKQIGEQATNILSLYSRANEDEADDLGISIASKAGFAPNGFRHLAEVYLNEKDSHQLTGLKDSHPGWLDRYRTVGTRVTDEEYLQSVDSYVKDGNTTALKRTVDEWLQQLPDSGKAWYFKGSIQRQMHSIKSVASFENAFLAGKPGINTDEERFLDAWAYMCSGLFREGFRWESLWCIKHLKDDKYLQQYARETGQGNFIVAGADPTELRIKFERAADGGKVLRYDGANTETKPTPAWRGIRYGAPSSTR